VLYKASGPKVSSSGKSTLNSGNVHLVNNKLLL
jgi:hypothetical protein